MRKTILLVLLVSLAVWGCRSDRDQGASATGKKAALSAATSDLFVSVRDGRFMLAGRPHYFAGANFWQGMNLAVDGPSGDRPRLLQRARPPARSWLDEPPGHGLLRGPEHGALPDGPGPDDLAGRIRRQRS